MLGTTPTSFLIVDVTPRTHRKMATVTLQNRIPIVVIGPANIPFIKPVNTVNLPRRGIRISPNMNVFTIVNVFATTFAVEMSAFVKRPTIVIFVHRVVISIRMVVVVSVVGPVVTMVPRNVRVVVVPLEVNVRTPA